MKFTLNPAFPDATPEQKWDQFRLYRLAQMQMSDWTRTDDCGLTEEEKQSIFEYRALLRNAPNTFDQVENIQFPGYMAQRDYKIVFVADPYVVEGFA